MHKSSSSEPTYPRDKYDSDSDSNWNHVGGDARVVDVDGHQKGEQAANEQHGTQLPVQLCDGQQGGPKRQDRAEKVAQLQRAVRRDALAELGPRQHVAPVVQLHARTTNSTYNGVRFPFPANEQ